MKVPLLDLRGQNGSLERELKEAFERVLRSGQYILSEEVAQFEREIAEMVGVPHAIGTSSGTDALLLSLMTLGIGPGDEVLCPSFTFFATAGCVARVGATPVFVDSRPDTFNLDVGDAARRVTGRTRAIMPVHLFGQVADMEGVRALAEAEGLAVIEDAAQALGARKGSEQAGSFGTFGAFSFFPSKNLGALGDAGMLVTTDNDLADKARLLRTYGTRPQYVHRYIGANFRLDSLQAALLRVKLAHYGDYTRRRAENAAFYLNALGQLPKVGFGQSGREAGAAVGEGIRIVLPWVDEDEDMIWNQFTLRVRTFPEDRENARDDLRQFLGKRGIGAEVYYPIPLHKQECFRHLEQALDSEGKDRLPMASRLSGEVISIPVHPDLTRDQAEFVVESVGEWLQGRSQCG